MLTRPAPSGRTKQTGGGVAEQKQKIDGRKSVEFTLQAPQASSVVVAGSFNDWDPRKARLTRDGDGWKTSISLAPGRYEYRFVVDGQWLTDPNCKERVRNDYGSTNSVLVV